MPHLITSGYIYIYICVYIYDCMYILAFTINRSHSLFSSQLSSFDLTHMVVPWWQICYEWSAFGAISCAQWELLLDRPSMWEHRGPTLRKHSPYTVAHVQTIYLSIDKLESRSDEQCIYIYICIRRWQSLIFYCGWCLKFSLNSSTLWGLRCLVCSLHLSMLHLLYNGWQYRAELRILVCPKRVYNQYTSRSVLALCMVNQWALLHFHAACAVVRCCSRLAWI